MEIAFRADASVQIGTGHVMRCLTLADTLREHGAECFFLCRPHDGHLFDLVAARRHEAIVLPACTVQTVPASDPTLPAHAHWLGTDWTTDAEDSGLALASTLTGGHVDWLIVDHYALDRRWEQAMRPHCRRLLVVDDLADRPHDCDLLLDQNLGRRAEHYRDLLPPGAQTLIGPRYALLRPEFATLRTESLARRKQPQFRHLLITIGGVDKDNATGRVLDALDGCDLPSDLEITVVLGPHAPWLSQVQTQAATMRWPTRVLVGVSDMARLMTDADLAIGAAGSTSWERCSLGIPSLLLVLTGNQVPGAQALALAGAAMVVGDHAKTEWRECLGEALSGLHEAGALAALSARAAGICDGKGAARVRTVIETSHVTIREAGPNDVKRIWEWRYQGDTSRYYISSSIPTLCDHQKWFKKALHENDRMLLIACRNGNPVAHVRLDRQQADPVTALVSICVSPAFRGQGIAGPAMQVALDHAEQKGITRFLAQVHSDNRPSITLFERCGFLRAGHNGDFIDYSLDRSMRYEERKC